MRNKFLISNYRESKNSQFVLNIVGEGEYQGEPAFICTHNYELSPCKEIFEEGYSFIRKSLVEKKDNLYSFYKPKKRYVQLSLWGQEL